MEWEAYLADGTTRSSRDTRWEDVPDTVLVLRTWAPNRVIWGDAWYGRPDTLKGSADVPDAHFNAVLARAQLASVRPSERERD